MRPLNTLVASAFSGFVVWHMGYCASGPLLAATPDSFVAEPLGEPLAITESISSTWNLIAVAAPIAAVSLALYLIAPRHDNAIVLLTVDARQKEAKIEQDGSPRLPPGSIRGDHSGAALKQTHAHGAIGQRPYQKIHWSYRDCGPLGYERPAHPVMDRVENAQDAMWVRSGTRGYPHRPVELI